MSPWPVSTITPTCGSSRAASSARLSSMIVCGRNALRTSGPVDRDLHDAVAAELVADVLVVAAGAPLGGGADGRRARVVLGAHLGVQASFHVVEVDAWLPRAAAAHPRRLAVGSLGYVRLLDEAQSAARRLRGAAGSRHGDRVAVTLPPGEALRDRAARLPAARRRRRADRPAAAGGRAGRSRRGLRRARGRRRSSGDEDPARRPARPARPGRARPSSSTRPAPAPARDRSR